MNHTPTMLDLLERLEGLTSISECVLNDLDSTQTGWYYQFQSQIQSANNLIRKAKGELK